MSFPAFTLNSLPSAAVGGVSKQLHGAWPLAEVKPGQLDRGKDGLPLPREMTTLNNGHRSEVWETAELTLPPQEPKTRTFKLRWERSTAARGFANISQEDQVPATLQLTPVQQDRIPSVPVTKPDTSLYLLTLHICLCHIMGLSCH